MPIKMKEQRNSGCFFCVCGGDSTQRENEGTSFKKDILKLYQEMQVETARGEQGSRCRITDMKVAGRVC